MFSESYIYIYTLFVCSSGLPADRLFCNFQPLKQTLQLWFRNCLASISSFACVFPPKCPVLLFSRPLDLPLLCQLRCRCCLFPHNDIAPLPLFRCPRNICLSKLLPLSHSFGCPLLLIFFFVFLRFSRNRILGKVSPCKKKCCVGRVFYRKYNI